ncbi:MAG: biotin--[acetyl-CoA-carboxylase] ligase [Magnetovibrio sp.]|nr:biotin--[acetyl-CoA-carboxylase] ligase [Magnetovibrio sp.]|tara:strand:+ start:267 stop:1031 length:765 start_codon:yes stop_codon:yes gene_type:complete
MESIKLPLVYNLIALESVTSTNDEAKLLARKGELKVPDGTLVWAREQTKGRGRFGRSWSSPTGNLYTSLILRPDIPLFKMAELSFVAALAVYDALGSLGEPGHQVHLKWPNDILLNEKKVAGILLETEGSDKNKKTDWVVLGMGMNVGGHPDDTSYPATSLRFEQWATTVEQVLEAYARSFLSWTNRWLDEGFEPIRKDWLWRCKGKGEQIEVQVGPKVFSGIFRDLDKNGSLMLDSGDKVRHISAGDVFFSKI